MIIWILHGIILEIFDKKLDKKTTRIQKKKQDKKIYTECAVLGALVIVVITIKIINNSKKKKEQDLSELYD